MRLKKLFLLGGLLTAFFLSATAQAAQAEAPVQPAKEATAPATPEKIKDVPIVTADVQAPSENAIEAPVIAAGSPVSPEKAKDSTQPANAASNKDDSAPEPPPIETPDALVSYNRVVFHFNDTLDRLFLKPVAVLYNKVLPKPLHHMVTNFFSNIDTIPTIANDLLQIKLYYVLNDGWRLAINSTVGLLGLFDVASHMGLPPHHEDFGLTLAYWGYKDSNYFEVPFFGSGTIRDALGWPVDYFFFSVYPYISNPVARYSLYGVGVVDRRANFLQYQDVIDQVVIDRYTFYRNAYLQHRRYQIEENKESKRPSPQ